MMRKESLKSGKMWKEIQKKEEQMGEEEVDKEKPDI